MEIENYKTDSNVTSPQYKIEIAVKTVSQIF